MPARRGAEKMRMKSFAAPARGWIADENPAAARPGGAWRLDNWFPTQTGIRLRGGSRRHATIGSLPVESLFCWRSGGMERFFAADAQGVFDITAPADPGVAPAAAIAGRTGGHYSAVSFTTAGGDFLYILNGSDDAQLYDGSAWTPVNAASTPAIAGVASADLAQGWVYRNRLFFVEKGSMSVWYPPVGALGGVLSSLTLSGTFKRGGAILFGATWSLDAGDGIDDKCVIVSSEGEVAVFEGADPSDAGDWRLVGVYAVSRPLGKNGWLSIGGDLLILTEEGIVPVSQVITKDPAALSLAAVTRAIEPEWKAAVRRRRYRPWELIKWPAFNMGLVNAPVSSDGEVPTSFVVNVETGAWARYTGWDTRCLGLFNDWAYFGTNDGRVMQCEIGGNDDGQPYTCVYVGLFDDLGAPGRVKLVHQGRASFVAAAPIEPLLGVAVDYGAGPPAAPNSAANYGADLWDVGLWDAASWDAASDPRPLARWFSIGRSGFAVAPAVQVTCGVDPFPQAELVSTDLTFEVGGLA